MEVYRLYILGPDGKLVRSDRIKCPDDVTAIEQAEQIQDGHFVELWQLDRRLGRYATKKPTKRQARS